MSTGDASIPLADVAPSEALPQTMAQAGPGLGRRSEARGRPAHKPARRLAGCHIRPANRPQAHDRGRRRPARRRPSGRRREAVRCVAYDPTEAERRPSADCAIPRGSNVPMAGLRFIPEFGRDSRDTGTAGARRGTATGSTACRERRSRLIWGSRRILAVFRHREGDRALLVVDWSRTPEEELSREAREILGQGLALVRKHRRAILVLRDMEELPNEEAAEILGGSVSTVKSRLHRARIALREVLSRRLAPASAA